MAFWPFAAGCRRDQLQAARMTKRLLPLLLLPFALFAQQSTGGSAAPATPPQRPPQPPVNHDFDFWIGDWEVTVRATGKLAGHNKIEARHGGRVLVENYTTPAGYTGMSLNGYDAAAKRWRQCWMDNFGTVLDLYGGLVDGKMVMSGETTRPDGSKQTERITWTPNADGTVRQHWEQSTDGGKTWTTAFDGLYKRKAP
jgi:Protein of unknown function (DUF1579)